MNGPDETPPYENVNGEPTDPQFKWLWDAFVRRGKMLVKCQQDYLAKIRALEQEIASLKPPPAPEPQGALQQFVGATILSVKNAEHECAICFELGLPSSWGDRSLEVYIFQGDIRVRIDGQYVPEDEL